MSRKIEGKILALLGMSYKDAVSNDLFNSLFESKQLEQIEDRYYLEAPLNGVSLVLSSSSEIMAIQLYSEGIQGYQQYKGDGINGLSFNMSQEQVHKIFGQPSKSGKGGRDRLLGQLFPWDYYQYENASLHCEYLDDFQKIRLMTIALPKYARA